MKNQMKKISRTCMAYLLSLCMLISQMPMSVNAMPTMEDSATCIHHTEHSLETCGYIENLTDLGCTHAHTEECYTMIQSCVHEHDEECRYTETVQVASPSNEEGLIICSHMCGDECYEKQRNCQHEHDDTCNYVGVDYENVCTFECEECQNNTADPVVCDGTKDCEAEEHEDECLAPVWAEFEERVDALPAAEDAEPFNDDWMQETHETIGEIVAYALEYGLYDSQDDVLTHPVIAALLEAMYGTVQTDDVDVVATIGETSYTDLKEAFDHLADNGGTIELVEGKTIVLSGEWEEVNFNKAVKINGNGAKITGLTHPLVMNSQGNVEIYNLTIFNSTIEGRNTGNCNAYSVDTTVGAFFGYANGKHTLSNCHVADCSITSREFAGGLIGYAQPGSNGICITECSVLRTCLSGSGSTNGAPVGGMIGLVGNNIQIDGYVDSNTVTSGDGEGWQGAIFGVLNGGGSNSINITENSKSTSEGGTLHLIGGLYTTATYSAGSYLTNPMGKGTNEGAVKTQEGFKFSANEDGTYTVETAPVLATLGDTEYTKLDEAFAALAINGGTLTLAENAVITVDEWPTVTLSKDTTIIGNNATIIGLDAPLITSATGGNIKIQNLKLKDAVVGNVNAGGMDMSAAMVAFVNTHLEIENCTVENAIITSNDYTGGFIGYVNGGKNVNLKGCTANTVDIAGDGSVGALIGHFAGDGSITGKVMGTNKLQCTNASRPDKVGIVIGRPNGGPVYVSVDVSGNNTVLPAGVNPQRIFGDVPGATVILTGGSYPADPCLSEKGGIISYGEGALPVKNPDGSYSVEKESALTGTVGDLALVGGATREDAIVIPVDGTVELTGTITIKSGYITFRGDGNDTIKYSGKEKMFNVPTGAHLNFEDVKLDSDVTAAYEDQITLEVYVTKTSGTSATDQVVFAYGDTVLGTESVTYFDNQEASAGVARLTYNTSLNGIPVQGGNQVSISYEGSSVLDSDGIIIVNLDPRGIEAGNVETVGSAQITGPATADRDNVYVAPGGKVTIGDQDYTVTDGTVTVSSDGTPTIPADASITTETGAAVSGPATVNTDGTATLQNGGSVTVGDHTVTSTGAPITVNDNGTIDIPASTAASINGATITGPANVSNSGAAISSGGAISVGSETFTVAGGGATIEDDGTVQIPSSTTVSAGGQTITGPASMNAGGNTIAVQSGGSVTAGDKTVTVTGGSIIVNADGSVQIPSGNTVDVNGQAMTGPLNVSTTGQITVPIVSTGGYDESYDDNTVDRYTETGWISENGKWYYISTNTKRRQTGWLWKDNRWYYLNPADGAMQTGWQFVNGKWYYLNPDDGDMQIGWQFVDGKWYYLNQTDGDMLVGWQFINGKWYYLHPIDGDMMIGWQWINGLWYYLDPKNGDMYANTVTPDGYRVDASGAWIP